MSIQPPQFSLKNGKLPQTEDYIYYLSFESTIEQSFSVTAGYDRTGNEKKEKQIEIIVPHLELKNKIKTVEETKNDLKELKYRGHKIHADNKLKVGIDNYRHTIEYEKQLKSDYNKN